MNTSSQLRLAITAILFTTISFATQAQSTKEQPVSKDGFWVVETTPKSDQSIVRFYTNEQKLIYEETVTRKLTITRRQTKQQLNVALDQAMFVWNATHKVPTERQWVAMLIEKK